MSDIESLATGLANGINGYMQQSNKVNQEMGMKNYENQLNTQRDAAKQQDELQKQTQLETQKANDTLRNNNSEAAYKLTLEGKIDPKMASQEHPELAQKAQDFFNANGRYATPKEGKEMGWFEQADTDKLNKQQDQLENQALTRMTQVRGDQSLQRVEKQRDAAAMAYDTIAKAKSEKRDLTQLEQSDLIGQLWQARSGKAPTDQDMKEMQDQTAKRGLNHMVTYLTGNPSLIGASTKDTLSNLQQFVDATGKKADQQFEGYWGSRIIKPTGLNQDRWDHISKIQRGIPYEAQKATSDKTYASQPQSGRVSVVGPDGTRGTIPANQLNEALKNGYKQG